MPTIRPFVPHATAIALALAALTARPAAQRASHGGDTDVATQRWIVMFRSRDFDLTAFRDAVRRRHPATAVAAVVADLERRAELHQRGFARAVRQLGGRVVARWWLINGCCVEVPQSALDHLRAHPMVARVVADGFNAPLIRAATDEHNHDADAVHALGIRGANATAAVLDGGFDTGGARPHRTFFPGGDPNDTSGGGIAGSRFLVNRQIGALPPDALPAHGTAAASVVAGADWGTAGADCGHAPDARIVGYAIADRTDGYSSDATDISAWQQLAADRVAFGIVTANNSYAGVPDLAHPAQVALDSAAFNADILIAVSAGNGGSTNGTQRSQSVANGLAVAAIVHTNHAVASFSSRGPLVGQDRDYPDIAACGVGVVMARAGDETRDAVGSGTSFSSPQVAGAATLVRGVAPRLSALQTKAILLASTQDISAANPGLGPNDFGVGMLRDDCAVALARRGAGGVTTATVDAATPRWSRSFAVVPGRHYCAVSTWHRDPNLSADYADLDLEVVDGNGRPLASSGSPNNLYELARFDANASAVATVRVVARSFQTGAQSQDFAAALGPVPSSGFAGSYVAFGRGCAGQGGVPRIRSAPPTIRQPTVVQLDRAAPLASATLITGFSDSVLGGFSLPIDLGPLGAPGCALFVSTEVPDTRTTDASGRADFTLPWPRDCALVGLTVFQQAVVLDGTANTLGVALSAAAALTLGDA